MNKQKMRLLKKTAAAAVLAILLVSCDLMTQLFDKTPNKIKHLDPLGENQFYAQNMVTEKYYQLTAEKLSIGEKCEIWAEKGSGITIKQAETIAAKYDKEIRTKVLNAFGKKAFTDDKTGRYFGDILEYANWLANGEPGKLTILLLNIKDNYKTKTDPYVAGYFFSGNFWEQGLIPGTQHYSNGRDMIYIDTDPGIRLNPEQTYATFAHELQHLINWVTSRQMGKTRQMDVWIDEGLSSQAEHIYLDKHPSTQCDWFKNDKNGTIAKGNNFFVWNNYPESSLAIMDEYATVYMFFRWLYLQADSNSNLFYNIENSTGYDYRIITGMAGQINQEWNDWDKLLRTWHAANYYPKNVYGYKGDSYLQNIVKVNIIKNSSAVLYPGEGVFSKINNSYSRTAGTNIRYAGISENLTEINVSSPFTQEVLLTYNSNPNAAGKSETGYLTGVFPSISRSAVNETQTWQFTYSPVIDARDLLGRNRENELPEFTR